MKLLCSGELLEALPEAPVSLMCVVDQERMIFERHRIWVQRQLSGVVKQQGVVQRMRQKLQREAQLLGLWSVSYVGEEVRETERGLTKKLRLSEEKELIKRLQKLQRVEKLEEQVLGVQRDVWRFRDEVSRRLLKDLK